MRAAKGMGTPVRAVPSPASPSAIYDSRARTSGRLRRRRPHRPHRRPGTRPRSTAAYDARSYVVNVTAVGATRPRRADRCGPERSTKPTVVHRQLRARASSRRTWPSSRPGASAEGEADQTGVHPAEHRQRHGARRRRPRRLLPRRPDRSGLRFVPREHARSALARHPPAGQLDERALRAPSAPAQTRTRQRQPRDDRGLLRRRRQHDAASSRRSRPTSPSWSGDAAKPSAASNLNVNPGLVRVGLDVRAAGRGTRPTR